MPTLSPSPGCSWLKVGNDYQLPQRDALRQEFGLIRVVINRVLQIMLVSCRQMDSMIVWCLFGVYSYRVPERIVGIGEKL
jgi:hypothetical protein